MWAPPPPSRRVVPLHVTRRSGGGIAPSSGHHPGNWGWRGGGGGGEGGMLRDWLPLSLLRPPLGGCLESQTPLCGVGCDVEWTHQHKTTAGRGGGAAQALVWGDGMDRNL